MCNKIVEVKVDSFIFLRLCGFTDMRCKYGRVLSVICEQLYRETMLGRNLLNMFL